MVQRNAVANICLPLSFTIMLWQLTPKLINVNGVDCQNIKQIMSERRRFINGRPFFVWLVSLPHGKIAFVSVVLGTLPLDCAQCCAVLIAKCGNNWRPYKHTTVCTIVKLVQKKRSVYQRRYQEIIMGMHIPLLCSLDIVGNICIAYARHSN